MKEENTIFSNLIKGNSLDVIKESIPNEKIDLILTSPPYGDLRSYLEAPQFDFKTFTKYVGEFYRILKPGGVIVWVVGDQVSKGSESGVSFKQVLHFQEKGFRIHDTMIYKKPSFSFPSKNRYHQSFEYMFILSKGKPKTFNPIKDLPCKNKGKRLTGTSRKKDGTTIFSHGHRSNKFIASHGMRTNVWEIPNGFNRSSTNPIAFEHPAIFPEKLARDQILSWSNKKDVVLDPFMGSGTTGYVCKELNRNFIGIEIIPKYFEISIKRLVA